MIVQIGLPTDCVSTEFSTIPNHTLQHAIPQSIPRLPGYISVSNLPTTSHPFVITFECTHDLLPHMTKEVHYAKNADICSLVQLSAVILTFSVGKYVEGSSFSNPTHLLIRYKQNRANGDSTAITIHTFDQQFDIPVEVKHARKVSM